MYLNDSEHKSQFVCIIEKKHTERSWLQSISQQVTELGSKQICFPIATNTTLKVLIFQFLRH